MKKSASVNCDGGQGRPFNALTRLISFARTTPSAPREKPDLRRNDTTWNCFP